MAKPQNLIQLIEEIEKRFGQSPRDSGVPVSDIANFYKYLGVRQVIEWLQALKKELESDQYPPNSL